MRSEAVRSPTATRVAVCFRCCMHYRVPVFRRLNARPTLAVKVFHGRSLPGTKMINAEFVDGFARQQLHTWVCWIRSSKRRQPLVFFPGLFWALMRYKPHVLITSGGGNLLNNLVIFGYAWLFGTPVIWWTLGRLPGRTHRGFGRLYRLLVERMERSSAALLGYSSLAVEYFRNRGYLRTRSFRAVNCVDTDAILSAHKEIPRGRKLAEPREGFGVTILYVGALERGKGVDRLVDAFSRLTMDEMDLRLLIVGDGSDRPRLENLVRDRALSNSVTFAGRVIDGVDEYFQASDVFVMPGLGGLAVSEAMAHGLPVICVQGDGCEVDLVRDGHTGYRVVGTTEAEITDGMTEKIRSVISDDELRRAMSAAALEMIRNEHNIGTLVSSVETAIEHARRGLGRGLRRRWGYERGRRRGLGSAEYRYERS